jgi:hypothetical protein
MVLADKVDIRLATLERLANGIVVIRFRTGVPLDLEGVQEVVTERVKMASGRRIPVMVVLGPETESDIRVNITDHGPRVVNTTLAEAVVAPEGTVQRLADLYYTHFHHPFPTAIFGTEDEALGWLSAQLDPAEHR